MKSFYTMTLWVLCSIAGLNFYSSDDDQPLDDVLRMKVQKICPVSGNELDTTGEPIKVEVGEHKETVYLCSEGCADRKIDPQHWEAIHINIATAQFKCPVMDKQIPDGAKWTVVKGILVYVCCPPCAPKIQAKPKENLEYIKKMYEEAIK